MISTKRILGKLLFLTFASLIVTDAALLVVRHEAKKALLVQDPRSFFKTGSVNRSLQVPSGFADNGTRLKQDASLHSPGLVVRYASRNCHWCQQDQPFWNVLAQEALQKHYKVLIVTPNAGTEYPEDQVRPSHTEQITFVDVKWLADLRLRGTPTTLIAGPHNELLWGHEGALTAEDVNAATATIQKAHN
jgi:hypothetical protein